MIIREMKTFSNCSAIRGAFLFLIPALIALALLCFGCNSSTKPKSGTLNGNVELINDTGDPQLDPVDFAGVTVALFEPAELDTAVTRINSEFPLLGIPINQVTEFDHRLMNPVKQTTTAPDGSFSLEGIAPGLYNLALLKAGWGFRYIYNIHVVSGTNALDVITAKSGDVNLYPVRTLTGLVSENLTLDSGRVYSFPENTTVLADVVIETGAVLAIGLNKKVEFLGNIQVAAGEGYWRITSSHGLDQAALVDSIIPFRQVSFLNPNANTQIQKMILDSAYDGMRVLGATFSLSESLVKNTYSSAGLFQAQQNDFNRVYMTGNRYRGFHVMNGASVQNSVFCRNRDPLQLFFAQSQVQNCYFSHNYIGVRPIKGTNLISHNVFDLNDNAISPSAANVTITLNNFHDNARDIELNGMYEEGLTYCTTSVSQNNFSGTGFFVHCIGDNSYYGGSNIGIPGVIQDQTYPNNYLREATLRMHIYDGNYPGMTTYQTIITFSPRRTTPTPEAGIQ